MTEPLTLVIDDDPTGIQTVHGVRVYYRWSTTIMATIFANDRLAFIQTNSRSLSEADAVAINRVIVTLAIQTSQATNRDFRVISRGDSSLRGHYPAEPDAIRHTLETLGGQAIDGQLLCFTLPEAGRLTMNNVHYSRQTNGELLPISQTEFARDATFGYKNADLTQYVAEKTSGRIPADSVKAIPFTWLDKSDIAACLSLLVSLRGGQTVIANAVTYTHLRTLSTAIHRAEQAGKRYLFRTAAGFVKAYAGITDRPLLTRSDLRPYLRDGPVLTVVGSHTANTTRQLIALLDEPKADGVELDVITLAQNPEPAVQSAFAQVEQIIQAGNNPVLFTSRRAPMNLVEDGALAFSRQVSAALIRIVLKLGRRPRAVIAKGGITSSDMATQGLLIQQAFVLGQLRPSIPVVLTDETSRFPAMPYVIFPGNTGQPGDLAAIWRELTTTQETI